MTIQNISTIEITAFKWVPPAAAGLVRDLRVRWALEEAGFDYRVRLLDVGSDRPAEYYREQPFGQVPFYREGDLNLFESGAIVQHIGEKDERLLPRELNGRARAIQWTYAALNSVEPALINLFLVDIFYADQEWAKLRKPGAEDFARLKLKRVSDWLGQSEWLEDRFTIGDLMMMTVLRILRHTGLVAERPNLAAYLARGEARAAFQRALAAQLRDFETREAA